MARVYNSKGKNDILEFLKAHTHKRLTAAEILDGLISHGKSINRSTIYRNLEKLTESGDLLCFRENDSESAYYQYSGDHKECNSHLHLQCNSCGKIFHLEEDTFIDAFKEKLNDTYGVEIDDAKTMLVGKCKDCKENGD